LATPILFCQRAPNVVKPCLIYFIAARQLPPNKLVSWLFICLFSLSLQCRLKILRCTWFC
jgi:hypothetical protein